MIELAPADVALIVGKRGSGKSHYTAHQIVPAARRCLVWDPHREYARLGVTKAVELDTFLAHPELTDGRAVHLSVVPDWSDDEGLADEFRAYAESIKGLKSGAVLVIDEVGLLSRASGSLVCLASQSRHWDCPLALVAQRAVQVPKTAREQATLIVSFRQDSPEDITALVDRGGEAFAAVNELPRYESISWREA